jgi:hypothetical protein
MMKFIAALVLVLCSFACVDAQYRYGYVQRQYRPVVVNQYQYQYYNPGTIGYFYPQYNQYGYYSTYGNYPYTSNYYGVTTYYQYPSSYYPSYNSYNYGNYPYTYGFGVYWRR